MRQLVPKTELNIQISVCQHTFFQLLKLVGSRYSLLDFDNSSHSFRVYFVSKVLPCFTFGVASVEVWLEHGSAIREQLDRSKLMLNSVFKSVWPVPIGFLLALLVIMACLFRKRFFSCLKSKQNSVESGTYRRNGELDVNIPPNSNYGNTQPGQEFSDGQPQREIHEWMLPNHESAINIISPPINGTLARGTINQARTSDQESFPTEDPPPSYSSLFYCPPPKYEDVVRAQWVSNTRNYIIWPKRFHGFIYWSHVRLL